MRNPLLDTSHSSVSQRGTTLGTRWVQLALGLTALTRKIINMCLYKPARTCYCGSRVSNDTDSTLSLANKPV